MKLFLMAHKSDCAYCTVMKPVFYEVAKEYGQLEGITFGMYDVSDDDWELADRLGLEGVPGFAITDDTTETVYEVNNEGIVDKYTLVSLLMNNISKGGSDA